MREGWLTVIRSVDEFEHPSGAAVMRYCAGVIIQDAERLDRVIFRTPDPSSSSGSPARSTMPSGNVVFPTAIDARGERAFDICFGMADYEIGCRSSRSVPREWLRNMRQHG